MRAGLCRAISANASLLASEGYLLTHSNMLDHLVTRVCITEEEYSKGIHRTNQTCENLMREIVGLILRRDCKTLLSFVDIICEHSAHTVDNIITTYDNISTSRGQDAMCTELQICSHCLLRRRVDPVQLIDKLLSHDLNWLEFYEQVTRWEDMVEKRVPLMDMFMSRVNDEGTSAEIIPLITETLVSCGFHSDIVSSLKEDKKIGRNSFVCKNIQLDYLKSTAVEKCSVADDSVSEAQLMGLKCNYPASQEDNTSLKQPWYQSHVNVNTPNTPVGVNAVHCMQELKLGAFELEAEESGGTVRKGIEYYNNKEETDDMHQSSNNVVNFFVRNSIITITGREGIGAGTTSDENECDKDNYGTK